MTRALKKKSLTGARPVLPRRPVFDGPEPAQSPLPARTLTEAGADWADGATLNLMRIYFAAITEGDPHGWIAAYDAAEDLFDAQNGPQIATLAAKTVQAIRRNRRAGFRFNTPCCPDCARHLTAEESHVVSALRALRQRQIGLAEFTLRPLCEGGDTAEVTLWMRELALALPPLSGAAASRLH